MLIMGQLENVTETTANIFYSNTFSHYSVRNNLCLYVNVLCTVTTGKQVKYNSVITQRHRPGTIIKSESFIKPYATCFRPQGKV